MNLNPPLPDEVVRDLRKARRLAIWTLGFLVSIVIVMYLVLGASQAMKTAWIEDLLSLLAPALFLLSTSIERKPPSRLFPYGFHRVGSLAFFAASCALLSIGGFLLFDSIHALLAREHPTIGSVTLFGREVWLGWLMIAALGYSVIPPIVLGRMKLPLARRLRDKVLHTDATTNAADWQTGLAGIAGILGIALGFWWADAAAAGLIALSVVKDGVDNVRKSVAELVDGAPRELASTDIDPAVEALAERLGARHPGGRVRIRETGRYARALISPQAASNEGEEDDAPWWLIEVSTTEDYERPADPQQTGKKSR